MQETQKSSDSQKAVEKNSELLILKAQYEKIKKEFEQLSSIHRKCRSQKEKVSVDIKTSDKVTCSYIAVYESM